MTRQDDALSWRIRGLNSISASGESGRYSISISERDSAVYLSVTLFVDGITSRHNFATVAEAQSFACLLDLVTSAVC